MSLQKRIFVAVLRTHQAIYEHSDGWIGHRLLGVPTLLVRSTGRRTGQQRTNALVYIEDDGRYVIVASNGGAKRAPAWLHNLRAEPAAEVQIGRDRQTATATEINRGDPDFDRLWSALNKVNRGTYDRYQESTDRPIPLVALRPT